MNEETNTGIIYIHSYSISHYHIFDMIIFLLNKSAFIGFF